MFNYQGIFWPGVVLAVALIVYQFLFGVKEEQEEMGSLRAPLLVSTQWLKQQLANPSSKLRVLDVTWSPLAGGYRKFVE